MKTFNTNLENLEKNFTSKLYATLLYSFLFITIITLNTKCHIIIFKLIILSLEFCLVKGDIKKKKKENKKILCILFLLSIPINYIST